jgi:hypothetical protein
MSNADKPAFPGSYTGNNGMPVWSEGMTKLEYFAGLAMQGQLAGNVASYDLIAGNAVVMAKKLLAELEKEVRA